MNFLYISICYKHFSKCFQFFLLVHILAGIIGISANVISLAGTGRGGMRGFFSVCVGKNDLC